MMKTFIASAAIATALVASPVYAADMSIPLKAQRMVAPVADWTGWNVGISAGARFAKITGTTLSFGGNPPPFPALASQNYDSTSLRVGGYLGYDWQFAPKWLVGLEGDFAWGNAKKHVDSLQGIAVNNGNYSEAKQTWDAGLRARLGYLLEPTWLIYVTGGVQWQHFSATENCAIATCGPGIVPVSGLPFLQTNDVTRTGWTIGAGVEKMLPGKWLVRGEYRYADYGTWTTTFGGAPLIVKAFDLQTHTALLGLAKKF